MVDTNLLFYMGSGRWFVEFQDSLHKMADTLFALPVAADSAIVMRIATQMGLDFDQFVDDYTSVENQSLLAANNAYLSKCGIDKTPTLLLNGHPLRNPNDVKYVSDHIDRVLNETR